MSTEKIGSSYEHALQAVYYDISNRGICVDTKRLEEGKAQVAAEISRNLAVASNQWGVPVFIGAANAPKALSFEETDEVEEDEEEEDLLEDSSNSSFPEPSQGAVNLNATQGKFSLLGMLKQLGYEVPKITKKDSEGEYEQKFSTGELAIQKMLAANQFKYPGGDPALRAILSIRELAKLRSSYFNARLLKREGLYFFLSAYNVAGTLSGRRSSKRHIFHFGNNGQNFPKHSKVAKLYRRCLVARPGNVLLMVDQIQAEDWPVSALAQNEEALRQLRAGEDRHSSFASSIFGRKIPAKNDPAWRDSEHDEYRYMGKKVRHASNYDMRAPRMADALAQEGKSVSIDACQILLDAAARADPNVRGVFHKYVQDEISKTRILRTPLGRERQFLAFRPNDTNSTPLKEAYAFIPQSTVGDNTGLAVLAMESILSKDAPWIVQEGHDSIIQDIPCSVEIIYRQLLRVSQAFNRKITFHNGIVIQIPIEAELAFDLATSVKIKDFTRAAVKDALDLLISKRDAEAAKNAQIA